MRLSALRQSLALTSTFLAILAVAYVLTKAEVERELGALDHEIEEEFDHEFEEDVIELVGAAFGFSGLAAAAAALIAGLVIGYWSQRRLSEMSAVLARIASGDLTARTAVERDRDDLDRLAMDIDRTAGALERAMRLTKDQARMIAHDLRTPIARSRATLEDALSRSSGSGDRESAKDAAIGEALVQLDEIARSFDALMRIAELESGARRRGFASIDLASIAAEAAEIFGPVIEDSGRSFELDLRPTAPVIGDGKLVLQLLANLIQNAIHHTPEGSRVALRAREGTLIVEDDGPGVPEDERAKVLQPLHRLDRSRGAPGAGLGLALVKAIVDLHEARLVLGAPEQGSGLVARIVFRA